MGPTLSCHSWHVGVYCLATDKVRVACTRVRFADLCCDVVSCVGGKILSCEI